MQIIFPPEYEKYINTIVYNGIMKLSKTEFNILREVSMGNNDLKKIAIALKKNKVHLYKLITKLTRLEILKINRGILTPSRQPYLNLLFKILPSYPELVELFADSGLSILSTLLKEKNIDEISTEIGVRKTIIYEKLKIAKNMSLVKKEGGKYILNKKAWATAYEFFEEYCTYVSTIDTRIPANSQIYYKNDTEILFSNNVELDAKLTAFSVYENYGIKILNITYYYYLPKNSLTIKDIFKHSLYIAKETKEYRLILYTALFYLKFKSKLSSVSDSILDNIKKVIKGIKIDGYPSISEIKEKAEIYNIKVK